MIFDKGNILVVDDDSDVREFLVEILVKDGYKVSAAANITETLDRLRNDIFDLVVLDLKLPDVQSTEGVTTIKDVSPHTKVIMITGFPSVETATSAMKNGVIDYIKKPFKNDELLALIEKNVGTREDVMQQLGPNIKAIRKAKGFRIKQLSGRSGLTESSISMIENAKISPSVTTLNSIAMALGVHPVEFFEIEKIRKWIVTKKGEREIFQFEDPGNTIEYLGREVNEIFISHLGTGQKSFENPITHTGQKLCYVLKGTVEIELENDTVQLKEGDSIFFDATVPHLWKSTEKSSTLWIVSRD